MWKVTGTAAAPLGHLKLQSEAAVHREGQFHREGGKCVGTVGAASKVRLHLKRDSEELELHRENYSFTWPVVASQGRLYLSKGPVGASQGSLKPSKGPVGASQERLQLKRDH